MRKANLRNLMKTFGDETGATLDFVLNRADRDLLIRRFEAADRRERECYHAPDRDDLAMHVADHLLNACGVEGWAIGVKGVSYVNMGDTYDVTVGLTPEGDFVVACEAELAEKFPEENW